MKLYKAKKDWSCPICNTQIKYEDLHLNEYFQDLLRNTNSNEVTLNADGGWSSVFDEPGHVIDVDMEIADTDVADEVINHVIDIDQDKADTVVTDELVDHVIEINQDEADTVMTEVINHDIDIDQEEGDTIVTYEVVIDDND